MIESYAGPNYGSVMLPRVSQEVNCLLLDGWIDRPIIAGVRYNGRGASDALPSTTKWPPEPANKTS